MGDRTTCTLRLLGAPKNPDKLPAVIAAIEAENPEENGCGDVAGILATRWPYFVFHEVNYAQLADDLKAALMAAGQSWWWAWEAGGDFPAGLELYDAATDKEHDFNTIDGQIALTFEDLRRPDVMADALRWQGFIDSFFALRQPGALPEEGPDAELAVKLTVRYRCPGEMVRHRQVDHIQADMLRLLTRAADSRVECQGLHVNGITEIV